MLKNITFVISILFLFVQAENAFSQKFTISEVNATEFPLMKASFIALDPSGISYDNLSEDDFDLSENGINLDETVTVTCRDETHEPEVSVLLILDQSQSMNETQDGIVRWDWVVEGATRFINTINFIGRTKVGITSFAGASHNVHPFSQNRASLINSLNNIDVGGVTRYNPPFLDPVTGAANRFLNETDPDVRRVVIFLTDGNPTSLTQTQEIITQMQSANIQVYALTLLMPMNSQLNEISLATGGAAYAVMSKDELNDIYEFLAIDIQTKRFCEISWISPYTCDESGRMRDLEIVFKKPAAPITRERTFITPSESIARVDLSESIVSFGDPAPGFSELRQVTITPRISDFEIDKIDIIPSGYFEIVGYEDGQAPPTTIKKDSSLTINVEFTQQGQKDFRQATMVFSGSPCPPEVNLVGGLSQVVIINPKGGDVYSTCDVVDINWGGVEPELPVNLYYSSNSGQTWNLIKRNATGLNHKWMPPGAGNNYRIRATVSPDYSYQWLNREGSQEEERAVSLAVQDDDLFFYVTGHFNGSTKFGDETYDSEGQWDLFLARYDKDGNLINFRTAGGRQIDTAAGVVVDPQGNAYITGMVQKGAKFGTQNLLLYADNSPYMFVAKYSPTATTPSVKTLGADATYSKFRAWGLRIRYKEEADSEPRIIVQGRYTGNFQYQNLTLPNANNPTPFTAEYDTDLFMLRSLQVGFTYHSDFSDDVDYDSDGNRYNTGYFSGNMNRGDYSINSIGLNDVYISKFGGVPGSEDAMDSDFSVYSPRLEFESSQLNFGTVLIGKSVPEFDRLNNAGNLSVEIESAEIIGPDKDDFSLSHDITGEIIQPGDGNLIEINFQPRSTGMRSAQLVVKGKCADTVKLDLIGDGMCGSETSPPIDMGTVTTGTSKDSLIICILKNTNYEVLVFTPVLNGVNSSEFDYEPKGEITLDPDSCLEMTVYFNPNTPGPKKAIIDFQLPEACESAAVELSGIGQDANFPDLEIDWKERRINAAYDSVITFKNLNQRDIEIESVTFEENPDNVFTVDESFTATVQAEQEIEIDVSFFPLDETEYEGVVLLGIKDRNDPVRVVLKGTGILPKLEVEWLCLETPHNGIDGSAVLQLRNPGNSSELIIDNIEIIQGTNDYVPLDASKLNGFTIAEGETEEIEFTFVPQSYGSRIIDLEIAHDAFDGTFEGDYKIDDFSFSCDAPGVSISSSLAFGNLIICDEYSMDIEIVNSSSVDELVLNASEISITGPDASAFSHNMIQDKTIEPESTGFITIRFSPERPGVHNARIIFGNSLNEELSTDLSGTAHEIFINNINSVIAGNPGTGGSLKLNADIPELAGGILDAIEFRIEFDQSTLNFTENFTSTLDNSIWQWNIENNIGELIVTGTGSLPTPFSGELISIDYNIYIGNQEKSEIFVNTIYPCDSTLNKVADFTLTGVCYLQGRMVRFSGEEFQLNAPYPNPASENIMIEYGVGFETETSVEIYNYMGERVLTLAEGIHKPGLYNKLLPVDELASGIYIIRMSSGQFSKTKRLVISK